MAIPINYRKSNEAQAVFDFTDIANNTGLETYYLSNCYKQSGSTLVANDPFLTPYTIPASDDTLGANFTLSPDNRVYNFDLPFNITRAIKGEVIFFLPHYFYTVTATGTGNFLLELYEYRNGTETFLVSGATVTRSPASGGTHAYTEVVRIPLTTRKKIAAGSALRFKLTFQSSVSSSSGSPARYIYADPSNTDATLSRVYIPFTIDA